jgi:tetratricopeptide (TPR) repeat protein
MSKLIFFIKIIMTPLLLCSTISCLSPYENHLQRAADAYSNGNYNEAIAEFTEVIKITPDSASSYYSRGACYYYKGQYDLAINDFTKAIELKDSRLDLVYGFRGSSNYLKGDYDKAISDFTQAIEIYPNSLYYNNRGLAYNGQKNYNLAIQDFTIAINLDPRDARPYSNRADSYIATGQTSLAIADLRKTIELSLPYDDPALMQSARERLKGLGITD